MDWDFLENSDDEGPSYLIPADDYDEPAPAPAAADQAPVQEQLEQHEDEEKIAVLEDQTPLDPTTELHAEPYPHEHDEESPPKHADQLKILRQSAFVEDVGTVKTMSRTQALKCQAIIGYSPPDLRETAIQQQLCESGIRHPSLQLAFGMQMLRQFVITINGAAVKICFGFMNVHLARQMLTATVKELRFGSDIRPPLLEINKEINHQMELLDEARHAFVVHMNQICKDMGRLATLLAYNADVEAVASRLEDMNMSFGPKLSEVQQAANSAMNPIKDGQQIVFSVLQKHDQFTILERELVEREEAWKAEFRLYEEEYNRLREVERDLKRTLRAQNDAMKAAGRRVELTEAALPEIARRIEAFDDDLRTYDRMKLGIVEDTSGEEEHTRFVEEILAEETKQLDAIAKESASARGWHAEQSDAFLRRIARAEAFVLGRRVRMEEEAQAARVQAEKAQKKLEKQTRERVKTELDAQRRRIDFELKEIADAIKRKRYAVDGYQKRSLTASDGYRKFTTTERRGGQVINRKEEFVQCLPNEKARLEGLARGAQIELEKLENRRTELEETRTGMKRNLIKRMKRVKEEDEDTKQAEIPATIPSDIVGAAASRQETLLEHQVEEHAKSMEGAREIIAMRKEQRLAMARTLREDSQKRNEKRIADIDAQQKYIQSLRNAVVEDEKVVQEEILKHKAEFDNKEAELEDAKEQFEQFGRDRENGPEFIALNGLIERERIAQTRLRNTRNEIQLCVDRLGVSSGEDFASLMMTFDDLNSSVERLPMTLKALHGAIELAATSMSTEAFRDDLAAFKKKDAKKKYLTDAVNSIHAMCELGYEFIDQPSTALLGVGQKSLEQLAQEVVAIDSGELEIDEID